MMDGFVVSINTQVTTLEIKELINKDCESLDSICIIRNVSIKELAILSYHCQSATRVCLLIAQAKNIEDLVFNELQLFSQKSFGVEHIKIHESDTTSTTFAKEIGGSLQEASKADVNLSRPDIKVISCNDKDMVVGIDLVGFDMTKRPYKLMAYPGSVNGAFAYVLTRLAGIDENSSVVDPFCGSATIPIETALFQKQISPFKFGKKLLGASLFPEEFAANEQVDSKIQVSGFDHQVKVMLTAQKNAKIAGVHDSITISKVAIDWIDAKFEENTVDYIITNPPKINKRTQNEKQVTKLYDELFYQAKYILKKKGTIAILINRENVLEPIAQKHGFNKTKQFKLHSGKQAYFYMLFSA